MKFIVVLVITFLVCAKAGNQKPQCALDVFEQMEEGNYCNKGDTDCYQAQKSIIDCIQNCEDKNKDDYLKTAQCAQSNCKSSNAQVQSGFNDWLKCANLSSDSRIVLFSIFSALVYLII